MHGNIHSTLTVLILSLFTLTLASPALAQPQIPFTEDFVTDSANWRDAVGVGVLDWLANGGPDGGAFAQGPFNFVASQPDDTPVILRAHDSFGSSGGAFTGNWINAGVTLLSAQVRHNATVPLTYFVRLVGPNNFPGAVAINFAPAPPNQWTEISFVIDENSPQFVTFEGSDFATIFSDIANIQFGVSVPPALSGVNQEFAFDVDKVTIVPEPAMIALLGLGALVLARRRHAGKEVVQ